MALRRDASPLTLTDAWLHGLFTLQVLILSYLVKLFFFFFFFFKILFQRESARAGGGAEGEREAYCLLTVEAVIGFNPRKQRS